jgi:uncharacterized membrane protein YgcG
MLLPLACRGDYHEGKRGSTAVSLRGVYQHLPALDLCSSFLTNISALNPRSNCSQPRTTTLLQQDIAIMTKGSSSSGSGSGSGSASGSGSGTSSSSGGSDYTVTNSGTNDQVDQSIILHSQLR